MTIQLKNGLLVAGLLLAAACSKAPDAQNAGAGETKEVKQESTAQTLTLDLSASSLKWIGTKVTGKHNGTVAIKEGSLSVKDGQLTGGSFVLDMEKIVVEDLKAGQGKEKLEGHLKAEDFFDAKKYPTAKFEITSVTADTVGGGTHKIEGNLTIKEVSKGISFKATVKNETNMSATANFNINRKDWGVKYEGKKDDLIRDEINFDVNLVAGAAQTTSTETKEEKKGE